MKKITIIGVGVMGGIFCEAFNEWDYDCDVTITNRSSEKLEILKDKYPSFHITQNNVEAVKDADMVVLAVKPQGFAKVAEEIKGKINEDTLILSIMTGVTIKKIKSVLDVKKVVRAVPNLGAKVNKSMTVWTCFGCNEEDADMAGSLFAGIGKELCVDNEGMIDKATAVSGSGPGFIFYILEQLLKSIEGLGFNEEDSKKLLLNTLDGSLELLKSDMDPMKLAKQVASEGGTTEAGFKVLDQYKMKHVWSRVLQKAEKRAKELSALNS
jgi:pyrroline-5-carboxylate reductase